MTEKTNEKLAPKAEIAQLSISLSQNPLSDTAEKLTSLLQYCKDHTHRKVQKIAILSTAQVFLNILPSYSVSKHSSNDNPSSDVRQRRNFESILLDYCRRFVQITEKISFGSNNHISVRTAAAKALSGLFSSKPYFNTGEHLSAVVIRLACISVEKIRQVACTSIAEIFDRDPTSSLTLKLITNLSTTQTNKISTDLLKTLLSIKFKPKNPKKDAEKEKKAKINDKELEKELREVDIIDDKSEQERNQIAVLEHLFATVFRFLKETKSELHFIDAMAIVRKYVKYINIDYVAPIISALKQSRFSLRAAIAATQTALDLCSTAEFTVDLREFYREVYSRSYEALEDRDALMELLSLFEIVSRLIDTNRTSSFAKRLVVMALHAPADIAATILMYIRRQLSDNPAMTSTVDFDFEAEGEFQLSLDDPDFCNGAAAKYWELAELCHHPNLHLKNIALELSQCVDVDAVRESDIRAAKEKRDWNPRKTYEMMDDSVRVFDTNILTINKVKVQKSTQVYDLP